MERIVICAALRWECQPVLRQLRQVAKQRVAGFTVWQARAGTRELWLVKTGIGVERAEQATRAVLGCAPFDLALSTGCAGALAPSLQPGDLVIATALIDGATGHRYDTHAASRERARAAAAQAALRVTLGPELCSSRMLASVAEKRAAAADFGAVAVDMEGTAVAACAAAAGVPFAAVRAVLDPADTELNTSATFVDAHTGGVKPLAVAAHLVRHPTALPRLLAMQRLMQAAEASLTSFFAAWTRG